jgi:septal ring factor EnvC (AmiA/AmiB activator)
MIPGVVRVAGVLRAPLRGGRAWGGGRGGGHSTGRNAPSACPAPRSAAASCTLAATRSLYALAVLAALLTLPSPAGAQSNAAERIRQQREELDRIRGEREQLRRRMSEIQGTVHDLSDEVMLLDRQADATARVVASLDQQLGLITEEVDSTTASLDHAQAELGGKRVVLRRRLVDIYKRGPLYSYEAILSAQSFGGLVARYKYLHLLALRDRALVSRVEQLRDQIQNQRETLVRLQSEIARNRAEKQDEEERLRTLEQQRQTSLRQTRSEARRLQARMAQIERSEARLASVISTFEEARRRAETRRNAAAPAASTLTTADLGRLAWPVDGSILYRFGRVVNPNNTTTRWNGIGIAAPSGTPVKAIAPGEVVVAEPIGTYGLTVIVQHGGGDYSVYGSLVRADVRRGQRVAKGQSVGAVGAADPDLPAHLHFEIRRGRGVAVDPLEWLRSAAR